MNQTLSPPNVTEEDHSYDQTEVEDNTLRNVLILIVYSLIIGVSFVGNCLVLKVVHSNRQMRTTTNLLIVSLTVSDLLTTVLNIPFNLARILLHDWPFSGPMCILFPIIQVTCVYVSTLTMAVISVHRYYSVTRRTPRDMSRYLSSTKLTTIIILIWIVSAILSLPHSLFNQVISTYYRNILAVRCYAIYPDVGINWPLILSVEVMVTQYLVPLSITCCLYVKIAVIINRQGQLAAHSTDQTYRRYCEAKRKRIVMLILVCATFAICWLPLNCYHLLVDLHLVPHNYTVFLVVHSFAMSSVCYNPVIYCWMNEAFRRDARSLFVFGNWFCLQCTKSDNNCTIDNQLNHRMAVEDEDEESQPQVISALTTGPIEQTDL